MRIPDELAKAAEFHTHLGPFLVVGLRMGQIVTREFGSAPFSVRIRAHTGRVPPYSCLVDGIQVSTQCTIGNGGLAVTDSRDMSIEAEKDGSLLRIALREDVLDSIERDCTEDNQETFACDIWTMPESALLKVERGSSAGGRSDAP